MNNLVNFELAQLLKEKGFDVRQVNHYDKLGRICSGSLDYYLEAPTIAEVVMWLYEKCNVWVEVVWDIKVNKELRWYSAISTVGDTKELEIFQSDPCCSSTEAYEIGIKYYLINLFNENN